LTKDLKDPSAVIVKLGDFGLATLLDSQTHHDTADVFGMMKNHPVLEQFSTLRQNN